MHQNLKLAMGPKVILIHPEPMPCIRNRAVFQRPLWFAENADLTILTLSNTFICNEIACRARVIQIAAGNGFFTKQVWKLKVFIWMLREALFNGRKGKVVYVFPQWGWFILGLICTLGYRVVVDMQHTPLYYKEYSFVQPLPFGRRLYYKFLGELQCFWARRIMKRVDMVVAMSHSIDSGFAAIFQKTFNVDKNKLIAVPNGVEIRAQLYPILKNNGNVYHFIYAGNIQQNKIEYIVDVLSEIISMGTKLYLHVAGKVAKVYLSKFYSLISKEKYSFVNYHGFLEHQKIVDLYRLCDFGLFFINDKMTDHRFSHPGKVLEYMLYGCIPVVSYTDSLTNVIVNYHNGVFVNNDAKMKDTILNLINSPCLCEELRKNAFNDVKKFDWEKINHLWFENILTLK